MRLSVLGVLLCAPALLIGCGATDIEDGSPPPLYEAPDTSADDFTWQQTLVDADEAGLQTAMTLNADGDPMLVYLAYVGEYEWDPPSSPIRTSSKLGDDGPSSDFELPPLSLPDDWEDKHPDPIYEVRFARFAAGAWRVERLQQVHKARGLSILQTSTGQALISFVDTDGGSGPESCMKTHLKVGVRSEGSWRFYTADQSEQPSFSECPTCGVCEVVGGWSSLAEGPGGRVGMAYRRARYTFDIDMAPDSDQMFVEGILDGSSLVMGNPEVVYGGESPGFYGEVKYAALGTGSERPRIVYMDWSLAAEQSEAGVWYAWKDTNKWQTSEIQVNQSWLSGPFLQMLTKGDELFVLTYAWKSAGSNAKFDLILLHSADAGATWQSEYLEHAGRAGSYASMAMDSQGRLGVSYYQCGSKGDYLCNPETDGLVVALRQAPGQWSTQLVANDSTLLDGAYTQLSFDGTLPVVAARSAEGLGPGGGQQLFVYFASR